MTTGPEPEVIATVLLGAEGVSDELPVAWARMASGEESAAKEAYLKALGRDLRDLAVDKTGRPYFWVTVLANAPEEVRARVKSRIRLVRFSD